MTSVHTAADLVADEIDGIRIDAAGNVGHRQGREGTSTARQMLALAESWAQHAGSTLALRRDLSATDLATMAPERRGLLACALELYDLAVSDGDAGQALADLGLDPSGQDAKRPGG